jgi:hypothetical protein
MATDKDHALYMVMQIDPAGEEGRIRILLWDNIMARQRFQPGQVRPHWKIYKRSSAEEARTLVVSQIDAFCHAGYKMTVAPVLVPATPDLEEEFAKESSTVSYAFRGELAKVDEKRAVPFDEALGA